jgi:adenylate cyclase
VSPRLSRRYDDAISYFERGAAEMESDFTAASFISQSYKAKGDPERMRSSARMTLDRIEKIVAAEPGHSRAIGTGVCILADLGEKERAKEWAIRARLVDPENVNLHYNLACAMVSLGEIDATLETLTGMASRLSPGMLSWLDADTDFEPIREEPRFKALMEQVRARFTKS